MILKSFGCSFIFGNELADDGYNLPKPTPSSHTWPALLARDLEYQYQCHAQPASGNLQILAKLLKHVGSTDPTLFVIGWTWIDRFDYCQAENSKWVSVTPTDTTEQAEFYYRHLHSQYRDKFTSLVCIKTAIEALRAQNHRFIMTYMDDLIFETQWNNGPEISFMQNYIRSCLENFEGKNFLSWSQDHGYPIGSKGKHPLEEAHRAAFELIKSDLNTYIK